jgi:hypothetical protein
MLVLIAQCLSPTTARQWRRAKRCQAGVRHRDSDYGAHTAGILSAPQRPTRTRSRRKTSCQTTCTCINETVKTDPSVMRVREHVDCTCVCDGNCFVISVLSHSLSCSLVSVRTLQCSAQCMVQIGGYRRNNRARAQLCSYVGNKRDSAYWPRGGRT